MVMIRAHAETPAARIAVPRTFVTPEAADWPAPVATCAVGNAKVDLYVPKAACHTITWAAAGAGAERLYEPGWSGLRSRREDLAIQQQGEEAWWRAGSVRVFRHVLLPQHLLSRLAEEVWDRGTASLSVPPGFIHDASLRYLFDVCFNRASDLRNPMTALELDTWANVLGLEVLRRFTLQPAGKEIVRERLSEARLNRVKEYVEANLQGALRLQDLATEAGYSPFYFARAFKATTGVSPHQYVLERRVERAKLLLRAQQLSLAQVAIQCGFSSQSHFSSQFRARVGVTPTAYRNRT